MANDILLDVQDLKTYFTVRSGTLFEKPRYVRAVDGVSMQVRRGKTLGLVGESGSGKSTAGLSVLRLIPATEGKAFYDGKDIFALSGRDLLTLRKRMQIVFQDPVSSLDPRMTVASIVMEPMGVLENLARAQRKQRAGELLERVGLSASYLNRYPHEFSGGQRQRIGIARALASNPDFIVCDEPVSALDVSIQAQILNLLKDLQKEMGLSYLFIAHNLAVVEHFADDMAVMYLGRIVEQAPRDELYANPQHPYTKVLLSAVPNPDPALRSSRLPLPGETPSPISPPRGCRFHPRCVYSRSQAENAPESDTTVIEANGEKARVMKRCTIEEPFLRPVTEDGRHCHACLMV